MGFPSATYSPPPSRVAILLVKVTWSRVVLGYQGSGIASTSIVHTAAVSGSILLEHNPSQACAAFEAECQPAADRGDSRSSIIGKSNVFYDGNTAQFLVDASSAHYGLVIADNQILQG